MKQFRALILMVLVIVLAGCPQPKVQKKYPPLFLIGYVMDTGAEPSFMITEDFNLDGHLDLMVANSGDHTLSYFKGNGDGTFKDQIVLKSGRDPICIAAGDFNNDQYPDIAVLNYADQNIQIYLNTRFGSFRNTGNFLKPGKIPINLETADLNNDGYVDLIVTMRYHKVVTFRGRGKARFNDPVEIPVKGQPTALVIGDYNHDQFQDVAVALAGSGNTGVQILWGKGNGNLRPSPLFKGGGQPLTLVNIDADGDGYMDLVTSSNVLHALTFIHNNGDETFTAYRDFASGSFPKFVAAADFSGDGLPDLAVSNSTDDFVSVSIGNGNGTFVYPPVFQVVDEYPQGIVTGDFNKDGLMDLAVTCRDKRLVDVLIKKNMVNPKPDRVVESKSQTT